MKQQVSELVDFQYMDDHNLTKIDPKKNCNLKVLSLSLPNLHP